MDRSIGNRCGHSPSAPRLSPLKPIAKGKGALPRILSLAAERAKAWYFHPKRCKLLQAHPHRQTRSERREACQIVIETLLAHLDLASLCLGTPTLEAGFIDIDMRTIVRESGIGQRRCERAIGLLKAAGFMEVSQPRAINDQGEYVGLRAVRVITSLFFEFLNLGPMLQRERAKARERLQRKAHKAQRKVTDFLRRLTRAFGKPATQHSKHPMQGKNQAELARQWNQASMKYLLANLPPGECRQRTNAELGFPPDYSPGQNR